jgi:DNA polymerase I-like protein with 3'-5' exonuclease and polymerase domains
MRGLIRPTTGRALAYVDWSQQEFGIAAALSGDSNMIAAYHSGDAYLAFAKRAGGVPPGATKETHGPQRELYKICVLATQYLMGEASLAASIGQLPIVARHLLRDHREVFPVFWRWADSVAANFSLRRELQTMFGWRLRNNGDGHERTGRNYPMQSTGAEIMRLAACSMTEAGVQVCCPIHDAFLIEAADADIVDVVQAVQAHMVAASRVVLAGFELRSDAKVIRYPDRYADPRGVRTWELVLKLLNDIHKGGYLMDNHLPRAHQNARGN